MTEEPLFTEPELSMRYSRRRRRFRFFDAPEDNPLGDAIFERDRGQTDAYASDYLIRTPDEHPVLTLWRARVNSKPHPEPMLLALRKLGGILPQNAVAIGDAAADIVSARSAGIYAIGATWGLTEAHVLIAEKPNAIASSVEQLDELLSVHFGFRTGP